MTVTEFVAGLAAAAIGSVLGIWVTAALMGRLDFHTGHGRFLWTIQHSTGTTGMIQRSLLSVGRAAGALLAARTALGLFGSRLTLSLIGAITALLLTRDMWLAAAAERGARLFPDSDPGAATVRRDTRIAIPIGFCASCLVGWLFLRG